MGPNILKQITSYFHHKLPHRLAECCCFFVLIGTRDVIYIECREFSSVLNLLIRPPISGTPADGLYH